MLALTVAGCASPLTATTTQTVTTSPIRNTPTPRANNEPLNKPAGISKTMYTRAGVLPLGAVPFDNMMLPLVSPDGRYVATQTGVAPPWSTILAEPDAPQPAATRVDIYALDRREVGRIEELMPPTHLATVDELVLLGRSCDAEGFLVESPRDDGSRWIGKVAWETGEVTWLVQDDRVNAFGSLGPDGRLAWCSRPVDGEYFDLVIRNHSGEWMIEGQDDEHWLMPTWSGSGDRLFVLNLRRGNLQLCYTAAASEAAFRQSVQRLRLSENASVFTAYQTQSGQTGAVFGSSNSSRDQLIFFHPGSGGAAMWRPRAVSDRREVFFPAGSYAAVIDEDEHVLLCTATDLVRQSLYDARLRMELVNGMQVPRLTAMTQWPYMLLSPREGYVGLAAMCLVPYEGLATR